MSFFQFHYEKEKKFRKHNANCPIIIKINNVTTTSTKIKINDNRAISLIDGAAIGRRETRLKK